MEQKTGQAGEMEQMRRAGQTEQTEQTEHTGQAGEMGQSYSKRMNGAQAIVEVMRREKVEYAFCVPGESYLELMDALYDSGIQLVATRHENGAAFMAEAYGKFTRRACVAMGTRGVGGSNLALGIHTAMQDSTPLVVFLGQVDRGHRLREGFQEVELDQFFGHIAKWTVEIQDARRVPELVTRAFRMAQTGRPGPVVVSLPHDMLTDEAEMVFGPEQHLYHPILNPRELQVFWGFLGKMERPVIIAGGGVLAGEEVGPRVLEMFAERTKIPVLASFRRHDVMRNDHPQYVGHLGLGAHPAVLETVREADVIIAIGTRLSEVTTQNYTLIRPEQTLIHIDIDGNTLGKVYAPTLGFVGDATHTLLMLSELLPFNEENEESVAQFRQVRERFAVWGRTRRQAYELATSLADAPVVSAEKVNMKRVLVTMTEVLPADTIITNDAGNFAGWLHSFYPFNERRTYIGPTSGAMGYGVPAAIGAKLAAGPERTVVSLSGDGGFMMTGQELLTAVQHGAKIIALVFNNSMYGTIRMHQEREHPYRVIGTDLLNPDFVALGQAYGLFSARATSDVQFKEALTAALAQEKPALIEVVLDPEQISVTATITGLRAQAEAGAQSSKG
jgi:acetolactate synthase-1/2/3 large subunit